jgi:tRNA pseudouridine38-40 synthase
MEEAPEAFHSRHDAIWREYRYRILERPSALLRERAWLPRPVPAIGPLRQATSAIVGRHDFTSFANASPDDVDPCCEILSAEWDCWEEGILLTIRADHFLYKMVRTLVGTLVRESSSDGGGAMRVAAILEGRSRQLAAPPAPAAGLCLERVGYDPPWPPEA